MITALAHPNIALIKYWGKQFGEDNIPSTPSLSITVDRLVTRTEVGFNASLTQDQFELNGEQIQDPRVSACLSRFRSLASVEHAVASSTPVEISSTNNFPTAAGLASSASGFAALTTALNALYETHLEPRALSLQSRLASASAARSHYGGFVALNGKSNDPKDWFAEPLADPEAWPLKVVVAICCQNVKAVPSSSGMNLCRSTSPYYQHWVSGSEADLNAGLAAIAAQDFERLAEISEHSCLKMHAVMMSAKPGLIYWNPATLACIKTLSNLRKCGSAVFFTIDAGPQVKAICLPEALHDVKQALAATQGVQELLVAGLGEGAHLASAER